MDWAFPCLYWALYGHFLSLVLSCKFLEGQWCILFFPWWQSRSAKGKPLGNVRLVRAGINALSFIHSKMFPEHCSLAPPALCWPLDIFNLFWLLSHLFPKSATVVAPPRLSWNRVSGSPPGLKSPAGKGTDLLLLKLEDVCGPDFLNTTLGCSDSYYPRH